MAAIGGVEPDWVEGDQSALLFPTHMEALREGGVDFLTRSFQAIGALGPDNRVARITRLEECPGGSTGRKAYLSVEYARPAPDLHTDLFVKFSRDFDDPIRDPGKDQMECEVRLAALSRAPNFPIAVPACYFSDYHHDSGSGILITQRIAFGTGGIERHYDKCLDHEMPMALEHYQLVIRSLARIAGTHRAGRLGETIPPLFPYDPEQAAAADPIRYDARQLQNRISRYADFAAQYPQLLPANIRSAEFIAQWREDVPRLLDLNADIKRHLSTKSDFIALCHWNANVDNAWFWRDATGALECGLMDWGRVGQMNVALSLWGALSATEYDFLDDNLDGLLALFAAEYRDSGGPAIDAEELKLHLLLFATTMGLAWLMDAPPLILAQIPDLSEAEGPRDRRFYEYERARTQLHMLTNLLNQWQTQDFGALLDRFESTHRDVAMG